MPNVSSEQSAIKQRLKTNLSFNSLRSRKAQTSIGKSCGRCKAGCGWGSQRTDVARIEIDTQPDTGGRAKLRNRVFVHDTVRQDITHRDSQAEFSVSRVVVVAAHATQGRVLLDSGSSGGFESVHRRRNDELERRLRSRGDRASRGEHFDGDEVLVLWGVRCDVRYRLQARDRGEFIPEIQPPFCDFRDESSKARNQALGQ